VKPNIEVWLWGTCIGYLAYEPGQREIATFEYDRDFIAYGVQISPLNMKHPPYIHSFPDISRRTFKGLPGVFADSLPDKFGNQLIDLYMAEKKIPAEQVSVLDRLLYMGKRSMGALEYQPAEDLALGVGDGILNIQRLCELADMLNERKKKYQQNIMQADHQQALGLIRVGSSAGGARSKAIVNRNKEGDFFDGSELPQKEQTPWLIKFDASANADREGIDPKGMPRVEFVYSIIAREAGIEIPETDYYIDGDDFHFLIKRFDRVQTASGYEKMHYASWSGLAHADRDTTGSYSYEQLVLAMRQMGLGQNAITELFRRAVFNVVGRNQDDHTKNFGFIMNKAAEWSLSPAFDMTYAYDPHGKWTRVHQIMLNGKQDDFVKEDIYKFGEYCNLNSREVKQICEQVGDSFSHFMKLANEYEITPSLRQQISSSLRMNLA
jgi:serine/threonine-protein kinase HipA